MSDAHTVTAFDDELKQIGGYVAQIGGMAERMVDQAMTALMRGDSDGAGRVIEEDAKVDSLQREVEEKSILIIAKRQPMAKDLREIVAAIRIASDLERVGDLAKNIAKRVIALQGQFKPKSVMHGVEHLAELSQEQLKNVLDSYGSRNVKLALAVWQRDEEIDSLYTSLFRELLTYMMEDPRNISFCTHLLFCAKNIERIGDHATNIAETVHYQITGVTLTDERPKGDLSTIAPVDLPQTDD
ncbi:MAG: phosphate signaling complex protein PhoU [Alphaproteobacteria bacterium]